ncbi:MAG: HAD family phosphatase [Lachnospiraceae bacterium]|nr:HAD family phosphatase [Lachnospiraceae bacterium]
MDYKTFKDDRLNNLKGAIFDMDGTLLNSMFLWDEACVNYLLNKGKSPEPGLPLKFKTMSITESAQYYREHYGITDSVETITQDINALLEDSYRYSVEEKPGAYDILYEFKENNIPMYIATSTDERLVKIALKSHNMDSFFKGIVTCRQVNASKRFPKVYDTAVENLGLKKEDVVVFEDSYFAINTLKNNNYTVVAISDTSSTQDATDIKAIADIYIDSFHELFN